MGKKTISEAAGRLQARIPVLFFTEGKQYVAFSPALDLSTCGDTAEQARLRLIEAATLFLNEIKLMGTTDEILSEYGWHRSTSGDEWLPPQFISCSEELISI